jgi:hypothetical protein
MTDILPEEIKDLTEIDEQYYNDFCTLFVDWQQRQILFELQQEINSL